MLDTLDIALVGMLERGANGDDTFRAWHLHLEVGVVGDRHKLGVVGTPKDGVVGSPEPHHLEGAHFLAKVGRRAEADGQVDLAEGLDSLPRRNAMELRLVGGGCNTLI